MKPCDFYDNMPVGVCIVKRDRRQREILYANQALGRMLGTPDELAGKTLADIWPGAGGKKLIKALARTTKPDDLTLPAEDTAANQERWLKISISEDEFDGAPCHILWATDISASKEAEARLQQAVKAADEAAEVKANFLATMSHEIRTPMQTIYGLLELIGEEKPDEKISQMVDTAKTSASLLLEILDDVLDLAKMDSEKMELDMFEVPVRTLVRGILEALAVRVHGQDVQLIDDIAEEVPFVIIGDPKRLRQIIMNLAGNALKFTKEGTVTVRVSTATSHIETPSHGLALRFEIIDTGIGMSAEACARLFQPFSQADNSTARKYGGTGLGLSICKKLTTLMGGQIGVESTEGKGSVFWFEIPTEEVSTEATTVDLPDLDGVSVLSVEDHPQGAREIVRSLESMGARVDSCPTYQEGLALAKRRPFDVGIIDQGLPDGLGLDLIREIVKIRPYMGLIMYTVRDDIGMQHTLNALGVQYLPKPASRLGLGEAVKDAARRTLKISHDGPARLLIAEDTASIQDILRRQLDKLGVEADFVENGQEALTALESGAYGILFTDLHMPEMDGYDLVEKIRRQEEERGANSARLPVIVLTADVQMAHRQVYLEHGFDECLLKPVSLGHFRQLLIRWGLLGESSEISGTPEDAPESPDTALAKEDNPAIDIEAMKEQMGAFDEGAIEMLGLFVEMTAPLIERIERAGAAQDYEELEKAAHSLKGGARSACCTILGDIAAQLQDDARDQKSNYSALVKDITAEFTRVKDAVESLAAPAIQ